LVQRSLLLWFKPIDANAGVYSVRQG